MHSCLEEWCCRHNAPPLHTHTHTASPSAINILLISRKHLQQKSRTVTALSLSSSPSNARISSYALIFRERACRKRLEGVQPSAHSENATARREMPNSTKAEKFKYWDLRACVVTQKPCHRCQGADGILEEQLL